MTKPKLASALFALALVAVRADAQDEARLLPAPVMDEVPGARTTAVAVLAGGCFWGVQGVYQHVKGVISAVSGYAGGEKSHAEYELVGTGRTGHAESVRITYDPRVITFGKLLQIFFSVAHDPTQLNRQGPDVGTQYRSAIFPLNAEQANIARAYTAQLGEARVYEATIVTTVEPDRPFFPAESYHQDFMVRYPEHPYIIINDAPKLEHLRQLFASNYSRNPVLVSGKR